MTNASKGSNNRETGRNGLLFSAELLMRYLTPLFPSVARIEKIALSDPTTFEQPVVQQPPQPPVPERHLRLVPALPEEVAVVQPAPEVVPQVETTNPAPITTQAPSRVNPDGTLNLAVVTQNVKQAYDQEPLNKQAAAFQKEFLDNDEEQHETAA